ncbi:MAG TPA: UMP kinase [Candidatus Thermoplasmatota archaeon]|nr:UMP kinase [Candidatus Thermoplasmatota archaeon]
METVSLVFGGSVLAPPQLDPQFLHEVARRLVAWSRDRRLFVVCGGGSPARAYIQAARQVGVGEEALDRIGIAATRLNASTLAAVARASGGDCAIQVPTTTQDALRLAERHRLVVMGGTEPGHSTDYVAVELALASGAARFVNATNVDGVYTRDPSKHKDAKRLDALSFQDLLGIIEERAWTAAGAPGVLDGPSTVLVAENGIPTNVCLGTDLDNLGEAVCGRPFRGTTVRGEKVTVQ